MEVECGECGEYAPECQGDRVERSNRRDFNRAADKIQEDGMGFAGTNLQDDT